MTMEVTALSEKTVVVRLLNAPELSVGQAIVGRVTDMVLSGTTDRMLLDLSRQESSSLNAAMSRNLLVSVDMQLKKKWAGQRFQIAILACEGTLGHGIGRMIKGHAYDLDVLQIEQFMHRQEALEWLHEAETA